MSRLRQLVVASFAGLAAWSLTTAEAVQAAAVPPVVMGYERLQEKEPTEAGEILLSELSCLACHHVDSALPPALLWKTAPNLGTAGDRLRAAYVRQFIADPANVKPGTTMPNLLVQRPEGERAGLAEDLTHFLMQLREAPEGSTSVAAAPAASGDPVHGQELYQSIGCIACHQTIPLVRLGEKYASGQLAHFLLDPLTARPAARMPDFHLAPQEATDLAAYLAPPSPAPDPVFIVDPAKAGRGAQAFQSLGCIACHGGAGGSKPLASLDSSRGCLADNPPAGVPLYPLSAPQRAAIRTALQTRQSSPAADNPKMAVRHVMLQRNCFACHIRDGLGGPAPEVATYFTSTKEDLGDPGRLPPPLDGVGRKLQQPALAAILRGQDRVRPYMRVRMADYGPELSAQLSEWFAKADFDPQEKPTLAKINPNIVGRNENGRELVGTTGYSCISCHDLHGHPSLGIGAYDLAEMPKRLRPEWMRDFLLNPAAFPTGTRMPAFWPGGKPTNPKLGGGGGAEKQIDSIRVYLAEADQSLPPEGFADPAAYELKPTDRPIIFRTFMEEAGTHAVAVGFPGGVSAAFDARLSRWAMAWRGRFLDADGTWHMRFAKMEKPLGDELAHLEKAGELTQTNQPDAQPKYRGFRVEKNGVPTFLYDIGALHIEDRIEPIDGRNLRRTLRVSGPPESVAQLTAQPPDGVKITIDGHTSWPVPLEFHNGTAEIVETISW